MRKQVFTIFTFLLILPFITFAQKKLQTPEEQTIMAAKQVLMRVIGMKAESFTFTKIEPDNGLDTYEVIALGGKVQVKGSSTIAMTRGAYDYLRKACNFQYTWSSEQMTPITSLPDLVIPRTVSPYKYRQYYNVCAYGYTTPFWKMEDWQRELDWMALHGINMPVAMGGQEAIWQKVYKDMGMTDKELKSFFNGPAFLPWQRMGNVNKHDAPLPQSYIDGTRDLQKELMNRMKQLGMEPIVPAFSGFVPEAYKRMYPDSPLLSVKGWCSFADSNQCYILPPGSSDFVNIGKRFIQEYETTYGKVNFYLADLFNENDVPVSAANRYSELADFGKSVFDAINAADPQGTWVMQGWLFYNQQSFWDKESVKALLSKVPNDRMMIIDLANEEFHGWEKLDGFYGKPWIYSIIHNYGGNSQMIGNLPLYATDAPNMLANPKKGNNVGFGMSPEGVQNNEVVYELLSDVSWSAKPIDLKDWMKTFVKQRYGSDDEALFSAWVSLIESIYSVPTVHPRNIYQDRPSANPWTDLPNSPEFDKAVANLLNAADGHMDNPRFKHDIAQLVGQYAGGKADLLILRALELQKQGEADKSVQIFNKVQEILTMVDGLTYVMPEQRLETWIDMARKWGKDKQEADYYEADAKRQVTMWGNSGTIYLFEYASKVWSGLIRDYYLPRWMKYASTIKDGSTVDFDQWEENWIRTPGLRTKAPITGDILTYARKLYNTAGQYALTSSRTVTMTSKYAGNNKVEVALQPAAGSPEDIYSAVSLVPVVKSKKPSSAKEKVKEEDNTSGLKIYYTTDGSNPTIGTSVFEKAFSVTLPATVKAAAYYNDEPFGDVSILQLPVSFGKGIEINPPADRKYMAQGSNSLNDGKYAGTDFSDGRWLGFEGTNVNATMDMEAECKVKKVTVSFLENADNKIFSPTAVIVLTSVDGINYSQVYSYDLQFASSKAPLIRKFEAKFPETTAKYVKVLLYNMGSCPAGSPSAGSKAWIFTDEVTVE